MATKKRVEEPDVARDDDKADGDDTEGHSMYLDPSTALRIARSRSSELEREARNHARAKEARPNKGKG